MQMIEFMREFANVDFDILIEFVIFRGQISTCGDDRVCDEI